jgi:heterodisulfide reductase subunit B2
MINLSYYPGCSLKSSAKFYDASIKKVFKVYDIGLTEVDDWSCCGASAAHTVDEKAGYALALRNIARAESTGLDVFAPCSACYSRSKIANEKLRQDGSLQREMNNALEPLRWTGAIEVKNIIEVLGDYAGLGTIEKSRKHDISQLKVVPYYGCVLTRFTRVKPFDDRENPESMDLLLRALGATVISWPFKLECCGASKTVTHKNVTLRLSERIMEAALVRGADAIVTPCPLCQMNLDLLPSLGRTKPAIPILFLTEVFEMALFGQISGRSSHLIAADCLLSKVKGA